MDLAFNVPQEELLYIYPDARQKLFLNMLENYKVFYPQLKRKYAALNFNPSLKCDYLIIFEGINPDGGVMICWYTPYLYTKGTICGYRYAVRNNLHKEFFNYSVNHFSQMPAGKFREFITKATDLSMKKDDPKYWKNPNNSEELIEKMTDLAIEYIPRGFSSSTGFKSDSQPINNNSYRVLGTAYEEFLQNHNRS